MYLCVDEADNSIEATLTENGEPLFTVSSGRMMWLNTYQLADVKADFMSGLLQYLDEKLSLVIDAGLAAAVLNFLRTNATEAELARFSLRLTGYYANEKGGATRNQIQSSGLASCCAVIIDHPKGLDEVELILRLA